MLGRAARDRARRPPTAPSTSTGRPRRWRTHEVTFPITDEAEILKLRAGDEVTVQGHIIGIRDRTQIRIFDQGVEPPMDLRGAFLLHTAPGVRKLGRRASYEKVCIGTTTSARMVRFTEPLGAQYGVRAICGKGGFPDEAIEPMQRLGMVYFAIVGGAAALETTQIEEIEEVAWEELMPECLWKFRVKDFGPLTVGIDAHGNSLYHDVQAARPGEAEGALCPALTASTSALEPRRRPHARDRQGPRPARMGGRPRDRAATYIDIVKLGWGTATSRTTSSRSSTLYCATKPVVIGGTLFEVVYARDKLDEYKRWLDRARLHARRDLRRHDRDPARAQARADRRLRARLHRPLRGRLEGLRGRSSRRTSGSQWIKEELDAGAWKVITEAREGGTAGIFRPDRRDAHRADRRDRARGRRRRPHLRGADEGRRRPGSSSNFGPEVNLGNIPPDEVIPLETLRLGLRGDTLKEVLLGDEPRPAS